MTEVVSNDRLPEGLLDTYVLIDIGTIDDALLPIRARISTVTLAELGLGIAVAATPAALALRTERLLAIEHSFDALPFCTAAARRFTSMTKLVVAAGRNPKPRRMDLMIAAIASANNLPLFTRNADDFKDLEPLLTMIAV
ncbi:type II toxin-antitoxin system VapC family toxin [Nocardia sp. 2]|uniref:Type II toxin-antitoxin system VapC family toxin n=1 Tax=Nocardia acididurans TaxID=2802282 RepID=A0ABS1M3K1_9NOCA|nr:type II toxin-antitoxin system VapC family toxin [Nocardia acididurans]MBL1075238.1 type II toxin-antitoxin system VapC family toxin [Nocardia acididurans]